MTCPRCAGLMLTHRHTDYDEKGAWYAQCLNCGHHTDAVMEANRRLSYAQLSAMRVNRVYGLKEPRPHEVEA